MTTVFVTSYARRDNDADVLRSTVAEICKRVRANLGIAVEPKEIGFFDTTDIQTGTQWQQVLGDALRRIRVLVCMCSPTYLNSEYCAKEFELFRLRLQQAGNTMAGKVAIIPVIWELGAPPMTLPDVISRFQYKDARFPSGYGAHGLSRLARFESQKGTYVETLEVLAEVIGTAYAESVLPEWLAPVVFDNLPKWYHNPQAGAYNVVVAVLHEHGTQWRPQEGLRSVGATVDAVAKALGVAWQEIPADETLTQRIAEAEQARHVAIVIVDADSAVSAPMANYLAAIDRQGLPNCAVVAGFKDAQPGAAAGAADGLARLKALVPVSSQAKRFHDSFVHSDPATLREALTRAITSVRLALVAADPAQKVEDAALAADAHKAGVPTQARPELAVPGGARG